MDDAVTKTLVAEIRRALAEGGLDVALAQLGNATPTVLRQVVDGLKQSERSELIERAPVELSAEIIMVLEPGDAADVLERAPLSQASRALDALDLDCAVPILEEMPPGVAANLAAGMTAADAGTLLQAYDEGSAGRLMTPRPFHVREDASVTEALAALRSAGRDGDAITYLYVVDGARHLVGVVGLRDAIVADPDTSLRDVMTPFPISAHVSTQEEDAVRLFRQYRLLGLPVIDDDARLVGVIRADRLVRQADEEAQEDLLGVFGVFEARRSETLGETMRHRLPWLTGNLLTVFAGAAVVAAFQDTLAAVLALAIFLPVVAGMGGNAGGQTVAVLVRMLALEQMTGGSGARTLRRELAAALVHGLLLGLLVAGVAWLITGQPVIGAIVGTALLGVFLGAGAAGTLIPLGLRAVGLDPAVGSTVLLTTVTDVVGFALLLGLATLALQALT